MPVLVAWQTGEGMPCRRFSPVPPVHRPYWLFDGLGYPGWPDSVYTGPWPASAAKAASTRRAV
jgi:hypothetical protein